MGGGLRGERGRGAAELGAQRLVVAPVAQPARPRPPVARRAGPLDGLPQRGDLALGRHQVGLLRHVPQDLALGQVHELKQRRHPAAQAPDHQGVELHLEQRARLVSLARRPAGLVVDDPDLAAGRDVQPVDVAAQPQPGGQRGLHVALPRGRLEPARVFEREVRVQDRGGGLQPVGAGGLITEQRGQLGLGGGQPLPFRDQQGPRGLRGPLGRGQVEQPLQRGVHQRAARRGLRGRLGQPVDHPEPV